MSAASEGISGNRRESQGAHSLRLYRRHPELFALANTVIDRACNHSGNRQALWFVDGCWKTGPVDGLQFNRRAPLSVVAGVYTCKARPEQIVEDMLEAQEEIMETA